MKKRCISLMTCLVLVISMFASVASAAEIQPRYEPCDCGGRIVTKTEATGYREDYGTIKCPDNPRFNCQRYLVQYISKDVCTSCGRVIGAGRLSTKFEIVHDHSPGRAIR